MVGRCILVESGGAIVWAYVVFFPGKKMFEFAESGIGAAFGGDTKKT